MKAVVVGSGGREHALVRALGRSALVSRIYAWPGSDGIFLDAIKPPDTVKDHRSFAEWANNEKVDLVVIGPELELVEGLADQLRANGISVFGPSREAAALEASKIFSKQFMIEYGIPTAPAVTISSQQELSRAVSQFSPPYVLKADGLAAGKGVFICRTEEELFSAGRDLFERHILGKSGQRALLEECLPGEELSVLVLTNGSQFEILPYGRDHKRLLDKNQGPNTGGMGVVAPILIPQSVKDEIKRLIVEPSVRGLQARGLFYRGILFIGVMMTPSGPRVLEYNVRWGDPEAQAILPLLDGDWAEVFKQVADGSLSKLKWRNAGVACVVIAAEGYPDAPIKGVEISGLSPFSRSLELSATATDFDTEILHAGTKLIATARGQQFVTNGGRVLNVVARAATVESAIKQAYRNINKIHWPGMHFRRDIGQ